MNIISSRRLWYSISLLVLVPSLLALIFFRLNLGIDFTGGSVLEVTGRISNQELNQAAENKAQDVTIVTTEQGNSIIRYRPDGLNEQVLQEKLTAAGHETIRFDQVGPSVSRDLGRNALITLAVMGLVIILYIAYAFRRLPPPVKPITFGVMTIIALLHDALFVLGIYAILGRFLGVQIDALIVTAILTVIGFSVHDTIVVFDRIRENLHRQKRDFTLTVNESINQVMVRSLNTSLVTILVLLALFLFSGPSIRYFNLALLLGMISGTYSSIFIAAPLLVSWQEYQFKRQSIKKPSKKVKQQRQ